VLIWCPVIQKGLGLGLLENGMLSRYPASSDCWRLLFSLYFFSHGCGAGFSLPPCPARRFSEKGKKRGDINHLHWVVIRFGTKPAYVANVG
jgi:hypothetical protein